MCGTYDYLQHSTFHFNLINFQLNTDFPSQFCIFYRKTGTVEERDKKRISFYCTMLVAGLVGCVRDDRMKGQETASFRL